MGSGGHAGPPPLRTLLVSPCAGDSAPCSLVNAMPPPCHRLQSAPCSLRTTAARRLRSCRRRRRRRLDCLGVAPMPRCRRCGPRTNMDHLLSHTGRDCLGLRRSTTAASVARGLQGGPARQRIWCTLTAAIPVGNPCCSCTLTRVRSVRRGAGRRRLGPCGRTGGGSALLLCVRACIAAQFAAV